MTFDIEIPLRIDMTIPEGQTESIFEQNAANLGVCEDQTSSEGNKYTTGAKGIPNVTGIANEDLTYTDIPIEDNLACIPVKADTAFAVNKAAPSEYDADGKVAAWEEPGLTGATTRVKPDGTVTVYYKIVVTNTGDLAAAHPVVSDAFSLPSGFTLTGWVLTDGTNQIATGTTTQTFTIPASVDAVAPGATREYFLTVNAKASELASVDWTKAGICENTGAGSAAAGGFFNAVTMADDDDGTDHNNDACVPVLPPPSVTLLKVDDAGEALTGATFQLYGPDSDTTPVGDPASVDADGKLTWQYLTPGTYHVKETAAPTGYAIDPNTYAFTLHPDGTVTVPEDQGGSLGVGTPDDGVELTFTNLKKLEYPPAGGVGTLPYAAAGLLLMALGAYRLRAKGAVMS